ncbi:hypothetical protein BayCH28_25685 [Mycolicibacterium sp. CH28]|uniref:hypothetical protein n=1 Tax=Mycolicibacterium sp. CH28 TaxID=2512237 RepID=UPI001081D575|nr:hypothetical protein BayCH28_25685 [Mycolicibacterium sp. CH28]
MRDASRTWVAVSLAISLLLAAFLVATLHLRTLTPLVRHDNGHGGADAAPIFGWWDIHAGWGTAGAIVVGLLVIWRGPTVARSLPWRVMMFATWGTAATWSVSLALVDGWRRGFTMRLTDPNEYLHEVPAVTDISAALRSFTRRIPDFQPDSWTTHVAGHPPGALLTFVWLDRLGLSGGAWAGAMVVAMGSSAAAAAVMTIRIVHDERTARAAAPFLATAPTAIWVAVSADGYFMAVVAWGIALCARSLSLDGWPARATATAAGVLLGWAALLSYGLTLAGLLVLAVLATARNRRVALRAAVPAVLSATAMLGLFRLQGFWWVDGYHAVQERYWQGIAQDRPFRYWGWANFASTVCAVGLGSVAGVGHALDPAALRSRYGLNLLIAAALAALVIADISMLSKAETERIWLPFTMWLTAAPALLPPRSRRCWLGVNVVGALVLNHVILTNW